MSVKANALIPFALTALAVTLTVGKGPIVEGLLNDYSVTAVDIAQVDDNGRCIMIVSVDNAGTPEKRVVCSSSGDVKLFSDLSAAQGLINRANFTAGAPVRFVRKQKGRTVGDPIATLKTLYKAFKAEKAVGDKALVKITAKKTAGAALGWNTAVGTPEAAEYADYLQSEASVTESTAYAQTRITALAASLTAAGVDPLTVV